MVEIAGSSARFHGRLWPIAAPMRLVRNWHTRQTIALRGDGGFTMVGMGDLLTQVQRRTPVVQIILNNDLLDFVNIEQREAGIIPFGTGFKNLNFARSPTQWAQKEFALKIRATFASFPALLQRRRLGGAGCNSYYDALQMI